MTGLFRRLAQQVLGPEAPRARTVARLPFAAPPAPAAETARVLPSPHPEPGNPDRAAASRALGPAFEGGHAGAPVRPLLPVTEDRAKPIPGAAVSEDSPRSSRIAPPISTVPPELFDAADDPRTAQDAPAPGRLSAAPAPGRSDVASATRLPREPPPPVARSARAPAPLLPEAGASAAPARPAATRPVRETQGVNEASGPPEVHVHIGRIEVRSVAEPPPARERARRAKPAMSLESYLARRGTDG